LEINLECAARYTGGYNVLTMRNQLRAVAFALAVALPMTVLSIPAPARAATASTNALAQTSQARLGARFGRRVPTTRYRYPTRTRTRSPYTRGYRRSPLRGIFGGVLKALGIAYLVHMLFGWGGGGSPFGLLLLVAIVLLLATRRRRRVTYF
jgi:uncharacterized membrane protein